jgi:glyoxylase-like metal-dependent hydrolase (beta-lactamase superfamily II)
MLDGGALFGVVPKTLWKKKYPANEQNLCNLAMRSLLICSNDRKILIDAGMGNTMPENLLKYYYPNGSDSLIDSLASYGFSPHDITDVVLTHLHFDHCGGAITKLPDGNCIPTFKNASLIVSSQQWSSALDPNVRERPSFLKDNIETIAGSGNLQLIDDDTELIPGLDLRLFDGHTAGQIIPYVQFNDRILVYTADLIPTAAHIPLSYVCGYDILPLLTIQETEAFLREAEENNMTLFFEHDMQVECCSLQETERGIALHETFSLEKFISAE